MWSESHDQSDGVGECWAKLWSRVGDCVVRKSHDWSSRVGAGLWSFWGLNTCLSHPNLLQYLGFSYNFMPETKYKVLSLILYWMSNGSILSYIDASKCELFTASECMSTPSAHSLAHAEMTMWQTAIGPGNRLVLFTQLGSCHSPWQPLQHTCSWCYLKILNWYRSIGEYLGIRCGCAMPDRLRPVQNPKRYLGIDDIIRYWWILALDVTQAAPQWC
jgi:hypothetical protein